MILNSTFDTDNATVVIKHDFNKVTEYWFPFGDGFICWEDDGFGNFTEVSICYELDWLDEGGYNIIVDNRESYYSKGE